MSYPRSTKAVVRKDLGAVKLRSIPPSTIAWLRSSEEIELVGLRVLGVCVVLAQAKMVDSLVICARVSSAPESVDLLLFPRNSALANQM